MYSLDSIIKDLEHFSEFYSISGSQRILPILQALSEDANDVSDLDIEKSRSYLLTILNDASTNTCEKIITEESADPELNGADIIFDALLVRKLNYSDVIFNALLTLATIKPINTEDPITLEKFTDTNNLVVTSSGHQFNLRELINYHVHREYRGLSDRESFESKWLLNPITNTKFHPRDVAHIKQTAAKCGVVIPYLKENQPNVTITLETAHQVENTFRRLSRLMAREPSLQLEPRISDALTNIADVLNLGAVDASRMRDQALFSASRRSASIFASLTQRQIFLPAERFQSNWYIAPRYDDNHHTFVNERATHLHLLTIDAQRDCFSIGLNADCTSYRSLQHNIQIFIHFLNQLNINPDSPNVISFPGVAPTNPTFKLRGSLSEASQLAECMFQIIDRMEGTASLGEARGRILTIIAQSDNPAPTMPRY